MNVFELTRALVDIESITNNEERAGNFLYDYLAPLAALYDGRIERIEVEPRRFNVFAQWGEPLWSRSPPTSIPCRRSSPRARTTNSSGDAAPATPRASSPAMINAAEALLAAGHRNFGLLFVVGEERNSAGAYKAAQTPRGSRYIINGEPTENQLALGSKGALRYEVCASGKMAHSAYPELGESAIDKLLDALADIRRIPLPTDPLLGPSTLNIGTIPGGRAPNVIADEARADIIIRLVGDSAETKAALARAVGGPRRTPRSHRNSCRPPERGGRHPHHRRRLHHRYSGVRRRLGPALPDRPRHHSRGAHARRARAQSASLPKQWKSIKAS